MSAAEVVHRVATLLRTRAEKYALTVGWEPRCCPVTEAASPALMPREIDLQALRPGLVSFSDSLSAGKIDLFEYAGLDAGSPVNWHREPLTGTQIDETAFGKTFDYRDSAKVGDVKVIWELGRHQFLVPIAAQYLVDRDEKHLAVLSSLLRSWLSQNPFGKGIHWCSALEAALRGMSWAVTHQILRAAGLERGLFSLDVGSEALKRSVFHHAWFIRGHLSLHSSANNHLIGELTGLMVICSVFAFGRKSDRWREFAWQQLQSEANKQVWPDGVNKEQALYYHGWVLEYFIIAYKTAATSGLCVPDSFARTLFRMAAFLFRMAPPGDMVNAPQIGDADDGVALRFTESKSHSYYRDLLATVAEMAGTVLPSGSTTNASWYACLAPSSGSCGERAIFDRQYPTSYPDGGYAILGRDDFHLVFDAGPLGYPSIAAHGHADALSICLAIDGQWWLVDPGTYAYHSEEKWRNYFRGTAAHNTVVVNNADQSQIGGAFLWLDRAEVSFSGVSVSAESGIQSCSGQISQYFNAPGVNLARTVSMDAGMRSIRLDDHVSCDSATQVSLSFHFAPSLEVVISADNVCEARLPGSDLRMRLSFPAESVVELYRGSEEPISGWYSRALGQKEPCVTLVARTELNNGACLSTDIAVLSSTDTVEVR